MVDPHDYQQMRLLRKKSSELSPQCSGSKNAVDTTLEHSSQPLRSADKDSQEHMNKDVEQVGSITETLYRAVQIFRQILPTQ